MKKTIPFILLLIILSCSKDRPPVDEYFITLSFDEPGPSTKSGILSVYEVSNDYFIVNKTDFSNGDTIHKKGKNINGSIGGFSNYPYLFKIKGTWHKKILKKYYIMEGTFIQTEYFSNGTSYDYTGTFEMHTHN